MKPKGKYKPKQTTHSDELDETYQPMKKWFEDTINYPGDFAPVTEQILIELKDEAKKCLDSEVANFNAKNSKVNPNYQWMKTVMSKGTVSDKIAAYTVSIQDNPLYSLEMIQSLINMVKVGKKKECTPVIDTLTELFLSDLLIPDQKLKSFHQRPLSLLNELSSGNAVTRRKLLSVWYFEDQLKELYTKFVLALNVVAHDTIDNSKEKAITAMFKLLAGNPEQEKNLLSSIVNKLGDPSQKVASKAIYSLGQLLFKHPNMQVVVLNEVEKLLFRSNVSTKAQYYGLCFLSQFYLSHDSNEVAKRLVQVYFSFFKACVKKGEIDSRMMSALLMGVNRAFPYAKLQLDKISDHIDTMYRVVHVANFNNSLHALSLLHQVCDQDNSVSDRFYSALYKKLLDPAVLITTHQAMLLSLVYKALLKDTEIVRVKVFVKRLLQMALFMQPSFACGTLYLVSQLMGKNPGIQSCLLKKNIKDEDDEEEKYRDVQSNDVKEENHDEEEDVKPDLDMLNASLSQPSWYHCDYNSTERKVATRYNPLCRNPLYAGGDFSAYTELVYLREHFHPTVALYATNLLEGDVIKYSGDPLKDFTLIRFLDRFVFKNPKKFEEGGVKGAHPTFGRRKMYRPKGLRSLPVNSAGYLNEKSRNIPVDELFMYRYLQTKHKERQLEEDDSDLESVQSEEFEEMLDKMASNVQEDEDLDFLNDIGDSIKTKNQNKKKSDDDEEELFDEDEENSEDDFEMGEDDRELLGDLDSDEDEDIVFDDEDVPKGSQKKKKNDVNSLFASAEEFASLLEEEGSSKIAPGGSNQFANKDKADVKQIAWESKRNRWLNGFNKAIGKNKTGKSEKRKNGNKFGNKTKKMKHK